MGRVSQRQNGEKMRLGVKQVLTVVKLVDFGVYLGSDEERVLLPKKQVPDGIELGDPIEVFLYKDSSDRMIATTNESKITLGQLAVLTVADVGRMGEKVEKGDRCLVSLYVDKSERLCATMKIYHLLQTDSPYKKDDIVTGTVYEVNRDLGAFVAVDNLYSALIPKREMYGRMYPGQEIEARVAAVKEDGKLDLSVRGKIPEQMDKDAELILECIETCGGKLPFTDKADPERIKAEMGMSKAAFKRAVGRLLKQKKIVIKEDGIYSL